MNRRNFLKSISALPVIAVAPFLLKEKKTPFVEIGRYENVRFIESEDPWRNALEPGVREWKAYFNSAILNENWAAKLL